MHEAYKSFLVIENTIIYYITKYINKVQINKNNKILLLYIIDTFHLHYKQAEKLSSNSSKMHRAHQQARKLLINSNGYEWLSKEVTALCFSNFCYLETLFETMISNIRLQKNDLRRIFHYVYKYKIVICISDLSFYQSYKKVNLKAYTNSFESCFRGNI